MKPVAMTEEQFYAFLEDAEDLARFEACIEARGRHRIWIDQKLGEGNTGRHGIYWSVRGWNCQAHRLEWMKQHREFIPAGHYIKLVGGSVCDNPKCVEIEHHWKQETKATIDSFRPHISSEAVERALQCGGRPEVLKQLGISRAYYKAIDSGQNYHAKAQRNVADKRRRVKE